jgi:hypothetical protein
MTNPEMPRSDENENITKVIVYRELSELDSLLDEKPPLDVAKMLQIVFSIQQETRTLNDDAKKIADELHVELTKYSESATQNSNTPMPRGIRNLVRDLFELVM